MTVATADLVLDLGATAAAEADLGAVLRQALERLRHIVGYTVAAVRLVERGDLIVRATAGDRATDLLPRFPSGQDDLRRTVVRTRAPVLIEDLGPGRPVRSWLAVPIVRSATCLGLLELAATVPGAFDRADEHMVAALGRALAAPVDLAARAAEERRANALRDAFIGIVSHELRTPITTIYGMSHVLRQRHGTMDPADQRQVIGDIAGEADRLRRLAEDLLVLSRTEKGRLQLSHDPLLLGHVVRRRIADEATRWPTHRFVADIPAGLPLVLGEEVYVEQVVQNLLSNAAKYSPPASEVRVVVEQADLELIVRVLDEGMGFDGESTDDLFELFYRSPTATRQASGAGIGLFVCRQLVEAMDGRIWAVPRAPRGAEFGFALPVLDEPEAIDDPD
jgi:two-component system sensor histidine kinase KdpD